MSIRQMAKEANVPPSGGIMIDGVCEPFWDRYSVTRIKHILAKRKNARSNPRKPRRIHP